MQAQLFTQMSICFYLHCQLRGRTTMILPILPSQLSRCSSCLERGFCFSPHFTLVIASQTKKLLSHFLINTTCTGDDPPSKNSSLCLYLGAVFSLKKSYHQLRGRSYPKHVSITCVCYTEQTVLSTLSSHSTGCNTGSTRILMFLNNRQKRVCNWQPDFFFFTKH